MARSTPRIPLLKGQQYKSHYFKESPKPVDNISGQFELHNRCTLRDSISVHRVDAYMIFLVTSGEGLYTLGPREHYLRKNMLGFVGPNVVSSWKSESSNNRGFLCSFSDEFFQTNRSDTNYLSSLPFFQPGGDAVLCLGDEEAEEFNVLFGMIEKEYGGQNASSEVLRGYLQALLGKAISHQSLLVKQPDDNHPSSGLRILKAFTEAFMNDFASLRAGDQIKLKKIGEYAMQLGVSQNHLNDTIKSITGRSAGDLLKSQLITHATVCIKYSSKSISEISYLLGFEDPSYFARFYKNQTGFAPSEHRATSVKSAGDPV